MSQQPRKPRRCCMAMGIAIILMMTVEVPRESSAQQLSRLPAVETEGGAKNDLRRLQQKVERLEEALGVLQDAPKVGTEGAVNSTMFWQHHESSPPSAELATSLLSQNHEFDLGGYVKVDFIHDFNAIATTDAFDPLAIPTDGRTGDNTRLHARQTRLNLGYQPDTNSDAWRIFVETDFFGTTDPFRRGRAFLRLRHAYIRAGRVLAGQTWSTFMDESILPATLDFESPRSVILDRRALIRWTLPIADSLDVAMALEDPRPIFNLDTAPVGDVRRPAPDLIGRFRYERAWGHLQGAGLVRMLRYREETGEKNDETGWGFNFTGRVHPHDFDSILFQVAFGDGIESYRQAPDAAVDVNGQIEVLPVLAWVTGYEIDWTDRFSSTFVYSAAQGGNTAFQLDGAPRAVEYLAANIVYKPLPHLSYGIEYLYGTRTDKNRATGAAHRLQLSVRFDLP